LLNIPNQDMLDALTLLPEEGLRLYEAPRHGLLKWIGNKWRFAGAIVSSFPSKFGAYFEPFVGSGAVLATVAPAEGVAGDSYAPLIEIWTALRDDPKLLKQWYNDRWTFYNDGDHRVQYEQLKSNFNAYPNGADLLFLCRSCYGGVVRFRKRDGYMSTPCGPHKPIRPESFAERVNDWSRRIQRTHFVLQDFTATMRQAQRGDLVYCDPPYVHTQKILYGAQSFDFREFLSEVDRCKRRGVQVVVSIDGHKRSGREVLELNLPAGLFEREIMLAGGASMLKRLQSRGEKLHDEHVSERLLLTY
jgi:DNA adenine methylase